MSSDFRPAPISLLPPVVKNLLIINGLLFLATVVFADRGWLDLTQTLGLYYPGSMFFKPYQLITHVFMHGSFMHLFFNMFSLWMFGSVLENYWGPKRFFIYYIITALGAAGLHLGVNAYEISEFKGHIDAYLAHPGYDSFLSLSQLDVSFMAKQQVNEFLTGWSADQANPYYIDGSKQLADIILQRRMNIPVVGASGAVFGLLLAFGMLFPNTKLYIMFLPIPIKAKYFVIFYGGLELWQGFANNPSDNVAHFAHLGGMLFGFFLIKFWNKKKPGYFY